MTEDPEIRAVCGVDEREAEPQDPFKNAMMFWKMCPHHYTNEDLYQSFKSRLIEEGMTFVPDRGR